MKAYRTNDGDRLVAETPRDLLEKLRQKSYTPEASLEAFEAALVRRVEQQTGSVLSDNTPETLVAGLITCGLVEEVPIGD